MPVGLSIHFLKAAVEVHLRINTYFRRTYFSKSLRNTHLCFLVMVFFSQEMSSKEKEASAQLFLLIEKSFSIEKTYFQVYKQSIRGFLFPILLPK